MGHLRWATRRAAMRSPSLEWDWQEVSGKGTIYSYQIIAHTVIPSFRDMAPFAIVLVELDEQSGQPTPDDGLRITANLVDADLKPSEGGCRQVKDAEISMNMGWGTPAVGSALIMRR